MGAGIGGAVMAQSKERGARDFPGSRGYSRMLGFIGC